MTWKPKKLETMDPALECKIIVAVVPESCAGPGWSNQVLWVYWKDGDGKIHMDSLQPDEWSKSVAVAALFRVLESAHLAMLGAVRRGELWPEKRPF